MDYHFKIEMSSADTESRLISDHLGLEEWEWTWVVLKAGCSFWG